MRYLFFPCIALSFVLQFGCSGKTDNSETCVSVAMNIEQCWEYPFERWANTNIVFRRRVDRSTLDDLLLFYCTNISLYSRCAVPFFLKFDCVKDNGAPNRKGALHDVRGDPEGNFCVEITIFGHEDALMDNRLYFLSEEGELVTLWSRRLDNIQRGMCGGACPRLEAKYADGMGTYYIRWSRIAPMFLGDDTHRLEDYLKRVSSGKSKLYWHCGKIGLHEGKHVYERSELMKGIDYWDTIIPLQLIFSANGTYVFTVGTAN